MHHPFFMISIGMRKKAVFGLLLLLIVSCKLVNKLAINHHANTFKVVKYTNDKKIIAYLPMVHISKPEFYAKIKRSVDSLRLLDYAVFYESISPDKGLDSIQEIQLWKKFRKVTGFVPYYENHELFKSLNIKGFIKQSFENTGVDKTTDVRADLSLNELISLYEQEKGEIMLSDYDLQVPLSKKYKQGKINKENSHFLIDSLRNDNLFKTVSESKSKKIAIVYGKLHMYSLFRKLHENDSLWHYKSIWEKE